MFTNICFLNIKIMFRNQIKYMPTGNSLRLCNFPGVFGRQCKSCGLYKITMVNAKRYAGLLDAVRLKDRWVVGGMGG